MSTTYIAMIVAILLAVGLLIGIAALSLLSGALNFLFVKPKIEILKSKLGPNGLAFSLKWDQDAEEVSFDKVRVRYFNPFGSPTQVDITREFEASSYDFVRDIDFGEKFAAIFSSTTLDKSTVEVEVQSSRSSVTYQVSFKGNVFAQKRQEATLTVEDLAEKFAVKKEKAKFTIPERTFIADPLPKTAKQLKLASNPIFAGEFAGAGAGAAAGPAVENFSVSKVWIEPGCIVCDACEGIFPEVFEVTDSTCIIRPGAPLNDGLRIQESAEACPVEVIKFTKA